jgi:intracellular sulfur oxidation DsrE/DsrF family protein
MIRNIISFSLLVLLIIKTHAQEAQFPLVPDFGGIYPIESAITPDTTLEYRLIIDLKTSGDPELLNSGLNNIARLLNLHALGGVSEENLLIVVAIHGPATTVVLNNEGYTKKFNILNPNLELIKTLRDTGVRFYVCGQSLLAWDVKTEEVTAEVKVGLSMLTVVSEHLMKGYEMFVFN